MELAQWAGGPLYVWMLVILLDLLRLGHAGKKDDSLKDKTLTITTILMEPYVMVQCSNTTQHRMNPNSVYKGYIVDLMDRLADVIGFKYRLIPVADLQFGFQSPDGEWNGMIGELLRGEADLAAAPMYVTKRRKKVVDFTQSYMTVGASLVMRRENSSHLHITSLRDLIDKHPHITFGTLNRGVIHKALKRSNNTDLQKIFEYMQIHPELSFTETNEEGIERVRKWTWPKYAYILQNVIADYIIRQRPCDLTIIKKVLIQEHFALALPKASGLIARFNRALTQLKRRGELDSLYFKWWWEVDQCRDVRGKALTIRSGQSDYNSPGIGAEHRATGTLVYMLLLYSVTMCVLVVEPFC